MCGNNFKNHNGRNSENYYVESFVHEIKTPISAISLACDNKEDKLIKKQIKKIDNIVEQMLFYARSDSVEKDYFVKKVLLEDVVHTAIMNYMDSLIHSENNKNNVVLVIEDNGEGILDHDLPRVFEYGFTGADRQKQYSTGIGLYLCKKLCNKMNLDIKIESQYKKFTKVKIIFPKTNLYRQ